MGRRDDSWDHQKSVCVCGGGFELSVVVVGEGGWGGCLERPYSLMTLARRGKIYIRK